MFTYCVTFRIADRTVDNKTYDERRQMLIDNVRTKDGGCWDETTSFVIIESTLSTAAFAKKACRGLSPKYDMVVVFDPSDMSANYFGPLKDVKVLKSFFPGLAPVK